MFVPAKWGPEKYPACYHLRDLVKNRGHTESDVLYWNPVTLNVLVCISPLNTSWLGSLT